MFCGCFFLLKLLMKSILSKFLGRLGKLNQERLWPNLRTCGGIAQQNILFNVLIILSLGWRRAFAPLDDY